MKKVAASFGSWLPNSDQDIHGGLEEFAADSADLYRVVPGLTWIRPLFWYQNSLSVHRAFWPSYRGTVIMISRELNPFTEIPIVSWRYRFCAQNMFAICASFILPSG
eukprot:5919584-Ditylum_brightwellii.AAC.1